MSIPSAERTLLSGNTSICRILNGMWQVSGGHGPINPDAAVKSMIQHHDSGFTTWDLADHYGPAEDFIKVFRGNLQKTRGSSSLETIQAFTKWVPRPGSMTREIVEANIDISITRMGVPYLDMLQFHWWDYGDERYLEAMENLGELRDEGKIQHLGLTNFDTAHLRNVVDKGHEVVSN